MNCGQCPASDYYPSEDGNYEECCLFGDGFAPDEISLPEDPKDSEHCLRCALLYNEVAKLVRMNHELCVHQYVWIDPSEPPEKIDPYETPEEKARREKLAKEYEEYFRKAYSRAKMRSRKAWQKEEAKNAL